MDEVFDYKAIYIKRLSSQEKFYKDENGDLKNIWYSIIDDKFFNTRFKKNVDYLIMDAINSEDKFLVLDITSHIKAAGDVDLGYNKGAKWGGINIDDNGDLWHLKIPYRKGDVLFERGFYDKILLYGLTSSRFWDDTITFDFGETYNKFAIELFSKQGLKIGDYIPYFYGYISSVDFNFARFNNLSISLFLMCVVIYFSE